MTANADKSGGARIPWRILGWATVVFLLVLPFAANAPWTASDYVFAAVLMGSVGIGLELAVRRGNPAYSFAAGLALAASFFLIWINGAVGIIGDEGGVNTFYLGVVLVALVGAIAARFRPAGMAWAMGAAAVGTVLIPLAAMTFALAPSAEIWAPEVPMSTIVFVGMWSLSAALFHRAAERS